ncbi:MAG TPA: endonuclease/exonuclease/phosphatase family protein [Lentimicrobium sp.]|nr:endonuclease/exonuclease/phosphatase family protein [Lentimicrobium sp.]
MKQFFNYIVSLCILCLVPLSFVQAQERTKVACISFYNLENLFDTIDDANTNDAEFLPNGTNKWTSDLYMKKLENMAYVVSRIGNEVMNGGPTIIGFSEVENRQVVQDLINTPPLKGMGYEIVHYDSPDKRGVDVALIYKKAAFKVINSTTNRLRMPGKSDWYSRDQLVVSGELDGEILHIIVNHWPSRASGPEYREQAALLSRSLSDSLKKQYSDAKIIIMGDLNDDPVDPSVYKVLGAKGKEKDVKKGELFNPMFGLFQDGIGSLAYRDAWNLFDQIIISEPLLQKNKGWHYFKAKVFNEKFLLQQDGPYKGYPFRTFAGGAYAGGYSDHFPTYMFLIKKDN